MAATLKRRLEKLEPSIMKHWYDVWASFMEAALEKLEQVANEEAIRRLGSHIIVNAPLDRDALADLDGLNLKAWLAWGEPTRLLAWPHYPQSLGIPPQEKAGTIEALLGGVADEGIRGYTAAYLVLYVLAGRVYRERYGP